MPEFNDAQKTVLTTYGGGDYAHLTAMSQCRDAGDTLFTFLMVELSDTEGCDTLTEAIRRVEVARDQLSDLLDKLEDL